MSILKAIFTKKDAVQAVTAEKRAETLEMSNEAMKTAFKSTEALALSVLSGIKTLSEVITNSSFQEEHINSLDLLIKETNNSLTRLYSTTEEMKKFTNIQTNNIDRSVESMEQLSTTITTVSSDIKNKLAITKGLSQAAVDGNEKVKQVLDMVKILGDNMESIKTVIGSINAISAQTNMLAMNAAIEAAHAGQAGRGFSVVADEIRKLSEVTRLNATNITGTVKNTIGSLDEVRNTVNKASETMLWIEEEVVKAASSFEAITLNMQKLDEDSTNMAKFAHSIDSSGSDLQKHSEATYEGLRNIADVMRDLTSLESQIKDQASGMVSSSVDLTASFHNMLNTELELQNALDATVNASEVFDKEPFPFTYTAIRHITWVARVRRLLDGTLGQTLDLSINQHTCDLGKWITGYAREKYGSMPIFKQLDADHNAMHNLVKEIATEKDKWSKLDQEKKYAELLKSAEKTIDGLAKFRSSIR